MGHDFHPLNHVSSSHHPLQACQLYTSVLMDSSGIDYHVVLCQNALQQCLTYPELQSELLSALIKQTSKHLQAKPGVQVTKTLNKIKHSRVSVPALCRSVWWVSEDSENWPSLKVPAIKTLHS